MNSEKAKYEHRISFIEKNTFEEMATALHELIDVVEISFPELSLRNQQYIIFNTLHSQKNELLGLREDELNIHVYKLIENPKNNAYYNSDYYKMFPETGFNGIFLILEEQTLCIFSNCNKLFLEVILIQGINRYDYDEETDRFKVYFSYLKRYVDEFG